MALELKRLIRNLANLKHKQTMKNKFLKTKPKIQEMKQNVEKAQEEAKAEQERLLKEMKEGKAGGKPKRKNKMFR